MSQVFQKYFQKMQSVVEKIVALKSSLKMPCYMLKIVCRTTAMKNTSSHVNKPSLHETCLHISHL